MNQSIIVYINPESKRGANAGGLVPYLTAEECSGLKTAMLEDLAETLLNALADLFVVYNGKESEKEYYSGLFPTATFITPVGETDGERMYHAMLNVFDYGCERCLLIGMNVPGICKEDFNRAFDELKYNDYVLGPTEGGQFWLVGARNGSGNRMMQPLFALLEDQTEAPMEDVLEVIPKWKSYVLLDEKMNLRTISDLLLFRDQADGHSAEFLKDHHVISVIVPVFNQVAMINPFLHEMEKLDGRCEVVFVDGGSTDGTWSVLREVAEKRYGFRAVRAAKGRGVQLNAGVEAANGDIYFFPNIDASLPDDTVAEILDVLRENRAGFFGLRFRSRGILFRIHEHQLNRRAKQGIILDDQGLFIERTLFYEAGMFDEINGFEDVQLAQELKKRNVSVGMTEQRLLIDAPHYRGNIFRRMHQMRQVEKLQKRLLDSTAANQLLLEETVSVSGSETRE